MNDYLQIFALDSQEIRTLSIDNEPWFVAKDVCEYFGTQTIGVQSLD